jgi:hypothetical protein
MSDEQDLLAGGGPKLPSLKFEKIGDVHTGVVSDVKKLEDRDPAGVAKTWPNGDPRFVYVITLKTEKEGDANLWARGAMITAIREAAKQASVTELTGNRDLRSNTQATERRRQASTHRNCSQPRSRRSPQTTAGKTSNKT